MISYENIVGCNNGKEGLKCMVCQHYYFKDKLDHQSYFCNECHDFPMTIMNLGDFFVVIVKNAVYRVYINSVIKKKLYIF